MRPGPSDTRHRPSTASGEPSGCSRIGGFRCKDYREAGEIQAEGGSGCRLEEFGNKDGLPLHVTPTDASHLAFPDHRHHLVSGGVRRAVRKLPKSNPGLTRRFAGGPVPRCC
jgi:hypothetical protein